MPRIVSLIIAIATAWLLLAGCSGFGTGNSTQPGSTPNVASQTSFRFVGNVGTPFVATVSDTRSSWRFNGVVPLNVIIANGQTANRIVATKLTNDTRLLSVEMIKGIGVDSVSSTFANYGLVVGSVGGELDALGPAANPDVRFYVKAPPNGVYNALVEDESNAFILQSAAPTIIFYDSPNGNSQSGRVDGLFTDVTGGSLSIDLTFNKAIVHAGGSGTVSIKIN
jgi:hypothetical protein